MKLQAVIITFFLAFLFSCKPKMAFAYSQQIVKTGNDIASDIPIAGGKVEKFLAAEQSNNAIIIAQQMEELAGKKLNKLQRLEYPQRRRR